MTHGKTGGLLASSVRWYCGRETHGHGRRVLRPFCTKSENICFFAAVPCRYGDSVDDTVEENSSVFSQSECAGCRLQGMRSVKLCSNKIPQVLNWRCQLTQVELYSVRKMRKSNACQRAIAKVGKLTRVIMSLTLICKLMV